MRNVQGWRGSGWKTEIRTKKRTSPRPGTVDRGDPEASVPQGICPYPFTNYEWKCNL